MAYDDTDKGPKPIPGRAKRQDIAEAPEEVVAMFLKEYSGHGQFTYACYEAGVTPSSVRAFQKANPQFGEACKEAIELYRESIDREAYRRGVEGWLEPVYSAQKGGKIGVVRKYCPTTLSLLMKGNIAKYNPQPLQVSDENVSGVLLVRQPCATAEEWAARYGEAARGKPAPANASGGTEGSGTSGTSSGKGSSSPTRS